MIDGMRRLPLVHRIETMTVEHCILTLLWSETDDTGNPLDGLDCECSDQLKSKIKADWDSFREKAESLGFDPDEHIAMILHPDNEGDAWNAVAHDFLLTRNGHGVGFWDTDRWQQPWGDQLTKLAESFGEIHCCVGDDRLIYSD